MATSQMIQMLVIQQYFSLVQEVYPLEIEAWMFVDSAKDTVVREIDSQKWGGILAGDAADMFTVGLPSKAFVTAKLLRSRGDETELYGPSCVASPPIAGVGAVVLRATESGMRFENGGELAVARAVGAHVYVDQV